MHPPQPSRCPQCSAPIMYGYTLQKVLVAIDRQISIDGDVIIVQGAQGLQVTFTNPGRGQYRLHKCSYEAKTRTQPKTAKPSTKKQKPPTSRERQAVDQLLEACEAQKQRLPDWLQARIEAIRASRGYLN